MGRGKAGKSDKQAVQEPAWHFADPGWESGTILRLKKHFIFSSSSLKLKTLLLLVRFFFFFSPPRVWSWLTSQTSHTHMYTFLEGYGMSLLWNPHVSKMCFDIFCLFSWNPTGACGGLQPCLKPTILKPQRAFWNSACGNTGRVSADNNNSKKTLGCYSSVP